MSITSRPSNMPPDPLAHLRNRTAPQMEQPAQWKPSYQQNADGVGHIDTQMRKLAGPADHLPPPPRIERGYMGLSKHISDQCELDILGYLDSMLKVTRQHPRTPDNHGTPSWAARFDEALRNYRNLLTMDPPAGCCVPDNATDNNEIIRKIAEVRGELDSIAYREAAIAYFDAFRSGTRIDSSSGEPVHLHEYLKNLAGGNARARSDIVLPGTRQIPLRDLWEQPDFRNAFKEYMASYRAPQAEPQRAHRPADPVRPDPEKLFAPDFRLDQSIPMWKSPQPRDPSGQASQQPQPALPHQTGAQFHNPIEFSRTIEDRQAQEAALKAQEAAPKRKPASIT